jgi:hypothetical protein
MCKCPCPDARVFESTGLRVSESPGPESTGVRVCLCAGVCRGQEKCRLDPGMGVLPRGNAGTNLRTIQSFCPRAVQLGGTMPQ